MDPSLIASLGKVGGQAKGPQGQPAEIPPNQLMAGENPGGSKFALGALQNLNKYLSEATDQNEISVIRSIILILTKLIEADQQRQTAQLPQDAQMMEQQSQQPQNGMEVGGGGMHQMPDGSMMPNSQMR